jgi:tetrahydromethanopterin S-methyltransferase subunit B
MKFLSKNDYLKLGDRQPLHTQIRSDLYVKLITLSAQTGNKASKVLDVILLDIFEDENKIEEIKKKVKNYR